MDRRTRRQSAPKLLRLAPTPGERAHICQGLVPGGDQDRMVLIAVMLDYSHAVWTEFCVADDDAALPEVLEHAWDFFGGSPRTWLFETMAPIEPRVLDLARRCKAIARLVALHDGVCWGEWALRSVPPWLLLQSLLRDLDAANRILHGVCLEMLERDHPQMLDRRVHEVLDEERICLRPAGAP
jgi:hypothetical protein